MHSLRDTSEVRAIWNRKDDDAKETKFGLLPDAPAPKTLETHLVEELDKTGPKPLKRGEKLAPSVFGHTIETVTDTLQQLREKFAARCKNPVTDIMEESATV
jgi:hypothetical protein